MHPASGNPQASKGIEINRKLSHVPATVVIRLVTEYCLPTPPYLPCHSAFHYFYHCRTAFMIQVTFFIFPSMHVFSSKFKTALHFSFLHNDLLYKCLNTAWQQLLVNSWKKYHLQTMTNSCFMHFCPAFCHTLKAEDIIWIKLVTLILTFSGSSSTYIISLWILTGFHTQSYFMLELSRDTLVVLHKSLCLLVN